MCAYHCAQLPYTTQQGSDYFPYYPPIQRQRTQDALLHGHGKVVGP